MKHWHRWLMAALGAVALAALALVTPGRDALALGDTIYVDADATGANNGTSWGNAFTSLQSALAGASSGDEIWVAAGTYTPTAQYGGSGNPPSNPSSSRMGWRPLRRLRSLGGRHRMGRPRLGQQRGHPQRGPQRRRRARLRQQR